MKWLTVDEIVELGRARRRVLLCISTGEWESREAARRGRNGKPIREVLLSSLPDELQVEWTRRHAATDEEIEQPDEIGGAEKDVTALLARYPSETREAFIAEVTRLNELMNRYDQINPKRVRDSVTNELRFVGAVLNLCKDAVCVEPLVLAREPKRGKEPSPFTLDGWSRRRKVEGLACFLRAPAKVAANDKRRARISPDAAEWLNQNWRNFPTVSHLYKRFQSVAKKHRWVIPSQTYVRRQIASAPTVVRMLATSRDKDYTSKLKPYVPRTVEDLAALQILCGDHHVLDVMCWTGKALVRLWLTVWQDLRTGLIWGFHLNYVPSSHTIAVAYANGVRQFGAQPFSRPEAGFVAFIYTDNGKDYRSRNLNGEIEVHRRAAQIDGGFELLLTQQKVGLAADADIKQMLARKYNGREKPVERTFRDLADAIQNYFFTSGWTGRTAGAGPDSFRDLYNRHVKAVRKGQESPFPAEAEIRDFVAGWIDDYNTTAHERTTLNNQRVVPLTEFNRLYTTRYQIPDEKLALLLMKPTRAAIGKNGVNVLGGSYLHPALSEFKGMKGADGNSLQVEVRYTDEDYSTVWIVLPDGRICEAERVTRSSTLHPNKETHKLIATQIKYEQKMGRDYMLLAQSRLRGETVDDRVAQLIEVEQPQELPLAVGDDRRDAPRVPTIQKIDRFDAKRLRAVKPRMVTTADVNRAEPVEFDDAPRAGRVSEFDFDE